MLNQIDKKISVNIICVAALSIVFFALGCIGPQGANNSNYRTVSAEPLRDIGTAKAQNEIGLKLLDDDDLAAAEKAFKKAIKADVKFGPAHNNLGKVYFLQKRWHEAAWEFEYARENMPRRAEPCNNIALVLEQAGELDRSIDYYTQAVSLDGSNIKYKANLARAMRKRGDDTDKLRALIKQILLQDTRPEWIVWAGQNRF